MSLENIPEVGDEIEDASRRLNRKLSRRMALCEKQGVELISWQLYVFELLEKLSQSREPCE
ncbi:MAG: hypothetical protein ACXVAR_02380 [Vulcanimicrobiaceae bacterium]